MDNLTKESIVQLVDTLTPGGTERMCTNLTHTFSENNIRNAVVITRGYGSLQENINSQTIIFKGSKKNWHDLTTLLAINKFIREFQPTIIHSHSTTLFWACILKLLNPNIKLIWHDHLGARSSRKDNPLLILFSIFIYAAISVNNYILNWHIKYMLIKKSRLKYIPNFALRNTTKSIKRIPGRIIYSASVLPVKNHLDLIKSLSILHQKNIAFECLLAGKHSDLNYLNEIEQLINENNLSNKVKLVGQVDNIEELLMTCEIGIINSISEGLPLSLLEYAQAGLSVIVTDVGQCSEVLENGKFGTIVETYNIQMMANQIEKLLTHRQDLIEKGLEFKKHVEKNYSSERFITLYNELVNNKSENS